MPHARFQTLHDLTDRMTVSEARVHRWIKGGALRVVEFGKVWRVASAGLDLYLRRRASRRCESASEAGGSDGAAKARLQSGA